MGWPSLTYTQLCPSAGRRREKRGVLMGMERDQIRQGKKRIGGVALWRRQEEKDVEKRRLQREKGAFRNSAHRQHQYAEYTDTHSHISADPHTHKQTQKPSDHGAKHQQTVEPKTTWNGIHGNQTTGSYMLVKDSGTDPESLCVIFLQRRVILARPRLSSSRVYIEG